MRIYFWFRLVILTCLFGLLPTLTLKASHFMGGEIYYRCVLQGSYEITVKLYRDCSGAFMPSNLPVKITSVSNNFTTYISPVQIGMPEEVSQICPSMIPNTSCNAGNLQGVQQIIYSAIYTFPFPAPDWEISYEGCCRNYALTSGAGGQGLALVATLNNAVTACNNSPYFTATGVPFFCAGSSSQYNHLVIEPDGDSLVYELVPALDVITPFPTNVFYNPGYTALQPIVTAPAASLMFSAASGQMTFTPASPQNSVVAVRVKEYRNGVMIGSVLRDMQFVVLNCPPGGAVSISNPMNVTGATQPIPTDPTYFNACPGVPMSFQVLVSTDTPNVVSLFPNLSAGMSGATISYALANPPSQSSYIVTINWTPPLGASGNFPLSLSASNDFCFVYGIAQASYLIHVTGMDIVSGNEFVCPNGTDTIHLATIGGTLAGTYQWIGNNVLSPTASETDVIITSMPDTFMVIYTEAGCVSMDTLVVSSVGEVIAIPDTVYQCNNSPIQLSATATFHFNDFMCDTTSVFPCGGASQIFQVGNGIVPSDTNIWWNQFSPFLGYDEDFKSVYLYRASDLQAAGLTAGLIQSLAFEVATKNSTSAYSTLTVGIRCTSLDSLVSNYYPNALIEVFSGSYTTTTGWNVIPFTTPYHWDGVSNLYISVCDAENNGITMGGNDDVLGVLKPYRCNNSNSFYYTNGCGMSSGFRNYYLPNIQFSYCSTLSPITYSWSPALGLSATTIANPILTPPADSIYVVSATQNGCTVYDTVLVLDKAPQVTLPSVSYVCGGESITLTNTGNSQGNLPVWTELNTGIVLTGNSITLTPLDTLHFMVVVADSCGNDSAEVFVYYLPPIQTQITTADASCMNGNIGSAAATVSGANGVISYSWNTTPTSNTSSIANLASGNYVLYIQDAMGCKDTATATVGLDNAWITTSSVTDVTYNGGNDGTATVTVGSAASNFTYAWNTNPVQITPTATNLIAGVYTVTITNTISNCTTTVTVTVNEPPVVAANIKMINPVSCFGKADAVLEVEASGGAGVYLYSWNTTPPKYTAIITGLAAGSYTVYLKEPNSPVYTLNQTYVVPEPEPFVASIAQFTDVDCRGTKTGTATVTTVGGNGAPSYQWLTNPPQTTQTAGSLGVGNYNVIAQDANGCKDTASVTIDEPDDLQLGNLTITNAICEEANGSISVTATGGNEGYTYQWSGNAGASGGVLLNVSGGVYSVTVTDMKGCKDSLSGIVVETTLRPTAAFTFTPTRDTLVLRDAQITFINQSQHANTYLWNFGDGQTSSLKNPVHRFSDPDNYTITLTAIDANDACPNSVTHTITIIPNGFIYLPSSFTPNDDGYNDSFGVSGYNIQTVSVQIYDRWGNLVITLSSTNDTWNGKDKNGKAMPEGVYTYKVAAVNFAGLQIIQAGTVTLIR